MTITTQEAEALVRQGIAELQQGRGADAKASFEQVTAAGVENAQILLLLATACRMAGAAEGEEAAVDRLMAREPRLVRAHIMKGDCRTRAGDDRAALGFYRSGLRLAEGEDLSADLVKELQRADQAAAAIKARFEERREEALAARGFPPGERSPRFQMSLDMLAGRKRLFVQEPTGYFFPELPNVQFFDPKAFAWVPQVEGATAAIRDELKAIMAEGIEGFRPYIRSDSNQPRIDSNPLLDNRDWSALFLCENGTRFEEAIERCPRTWEAVQSAPLPLIANSPTVMFSLLKTGARIQPHTGTHNSRLVCHLPLIVPPRCGFRVGNDVREWDEGRLLIFDDTIEHEAWNESDQDRVVLIFDIWRPELSDTEKQEIASLFEAMASLS
jgi:hypothetical protein